MDGHLKSGTLDQPLVTYVTVVRNNAATLHRAIDSVQRQTYPAVEHVIVDGCSTDATLDVIRGYGDRLDYYVSHPDNGLYQALNKAIPLARGDLICVLNSDDWLEADAAETAVGQLKTIGTPTLLLTGANVIGPPSGADDAPILLEWYPARVDAGSYLTCADDCHNGVYATRSAYERSGPYDNTYEIAADFKWLMSCYDSGVDFRYSRKITVNYVLGGVSGNAERHGIECVRVLRERFPSLTPDEAGGMYHGFFVFPTFPAIPGRPDDRADFVRRLLDNHSTDSQLLRAVASALLMEVERHQDGRKGQGSSDSGAQSFGTLSAKKRIKLALEGHPTAYRIARRLHARIRRS